MVVREGLEMAREMVEFGLKDWVFCDLFLLLFLLFTYFLIDVFFIA